MDLLNSFNTYTTLNIDTEKFRYYSLQLLENETGFNISRLPFTIKILLEFLLRNEGKYTITIKEINNLAQWSNFKSKIDIPFRPARIILQDSAGIPALLDLASLRHKLFEKGVDIRKINPSIPVDLVVDHSVQVDYFGSPEAFNKNLAMEYERNQERYQFLKWAQQSFAKFRVIPPAKGILHQINIEYLAKVVQMEKREEETLLYPDSLVGTDSHTTMINGLGILGWGVGGIEAEALMLGNPTNMLVPEVIGVKLTGEINNQVTATDIALTLTQEFRKRNVVGKFIEFFGPGLKELSIPDRTTIANMAPEYGASMAYFPIDNETLNYLHLSGRDKKFIAIIERYIKEQGLFYSTDSLEPIYSEYIEIDLTNIEPSIAGPRRPQDRIPISKVKSSFYDTFDLQKSESNVFQEKNRQEYVQKKGDITHGTIVIAAITSCTNTSNPVNMIGAGLLAKKAVERGLQVPKYVKTSLAPASKVVTRYLDDAGLTTYLEKLGFYNVGYGCTTCVGNSGPLPDEVERKIKEENLVVVSILSGNRNFEARIHPYVKANYLASPMMVIAFAIAGRIDIDLDTEPLGIDKSGREVFLKDILPSRKEIEECIHRYIKPELFKEVYTDVFVGDKYWHSLQNKKTDLYEWKSDSTYFKLSPFFEIEKEERENLVINGARALLVLGDSVTTDHISPVGRISESSPAGKYLLEQGVHPKDFNSYGSRRGNHEVMIRGTFSNPRIKNKIVDIEGSFTIHFPSGKLMNVFDAAMKYKSEATPLLILAGKEYGAGSARDWAAKGTFLLGVKAVLAESFERIHRSNLAMMGVLPLQFVSGNNYRDLGLTGNEIFSIYLGNSMHEIRPQQKLKVIAKRHNGKEVFFEVILRLDTQLEVEYYKRGGIFKKVFNQYIK